MKELISCWACSRDGLLRLDTYPALVAHDRGKRRCELPPRDERKPVRRRPARAVPLEHGGWIIQDAS